MTLLLSLGDFTGQLLPDSWMELVRVIVLSTVVYAFVILSHRVVGKRAASQMNNFDWIVTVAMGAITGSTILSREISLIEGLLAVATLLALQYGVTRATVEWDAFRKVVQAGPRLLYYEGVFLQDAMRRERVTEGEILHAVRDAGNRSLDTISAVVLEADGTLSVLPAADGGVWTDTPPLLSDVRGIPMLVPTPGDPAASETESSSTFGDGSAEGSSGAGTSLKRDN